MGRTNFWAPVLGYKEGHLSREEAVKAIVAAYKGFYDIFEETRAKKKARAARCRVWKEGCLAWVP